MKKSINIGVWIFLVIGLVLYTVTIASFVHRYGGEERIPGETLGNAIGFAVPYLAVFALAGAGVGWVVGQVLMWWRSNKK